MPYLNVDDGMDEHPKIEPLSDAAFRMHVSAMLEWSRTGQRPGAGPSLDLINQGSVRRSPRELLPASIRPPLRHRAKIPDPIRQQVHARDRYLCLHCGTPGDLTLDHIVPWSLGGTDDPANLQTLCRVCNARKGARV